MADTVDATTSTPVDVEVAGYHLGEYTWKIKDAVTKLHLQAPREDELESPEFNVGPFTCSLNIYMRQKHIKWWFGTYIRMNLEDSDKIAAWGGCTFELLDGEGSLIKSKILGDGKFEGTHGWGFPEFKTAEAVLKQVQGTNSEGTDLHLRVNVHAKGVPAQEMVPAAAEAELLSLLKELRSQQICERAQHGAETAEDTAEDSTVWSSDYARSACTGTLRFGDNSSVHIRMPLVATGENKAQVLRQHMACHQLMLENPLSSFTWNSEVNPKGSSMCALRIGRSLVEKIPLLQSLQKETDGKPVHGSEECAQAPHACKKDQSTLSSKSMEGAHKDEGQTIFLNPVHQFEGVSTITPAQPTEAPTDKGRDSGSIPFEPPTSVSGIACLLMLLEGTVIPENVFMCSCGPRLAMQTLWAASYLGHKKVEQVVTKWLYCVVLSMLAEDDAARSQAPEEIKYTVELLKNSKQEWQEVFALLPSDTLKTIIDDLRALLPDSDILHSKLLKLPVAIIDQWIDSCNGVISLQSTTVPDVASVLTLIDRLPHHPEVAVLHLPKSKGNYFSAEDTAPVLEALDLVLPAMPRLRVLGLTSLTLTNKSVHHVVSILSIVRDRLQGVALPFGNLEVTDILFQAIRKMSKLQTLRLDRWEEEIAHVRIAGLKPLKVLLVEMPSTEYVDRMASEAPSLKFCSVPEF